MDTVTEFIKEAPLVSGIISLLLAIALFSWLIYKNESFKMKDHSAMSWKALVNSWSLLIILIVLGLSLILKNL